MEVFGFSATSYQGTVVAVEVDIRRGIPGMDIVGLPGSAVREARDRIRVAVRNSGLNFPRDRILVNLSPADVPKTGTAYDLSIALAILENSGQIIPPPPTVSIMVLGELNLSGTVRPVPGVLPAVLSGLAQGIKVFLVAEGNQAEGCAAGAGKVFGINNLKQAVHVLSLLGEGKANPTTPIVRKKEGNSYPDFSDIAGKALLKRSIEVSVAGRHSLLLYGPPGGGKTMVSWRIPSIFPPLSREESLEVTRLHSLAGLLPPGSGLLEERPFRAPHHGASLEGLLGGGRSLSVGEISLAHGGTLFLDEAPEFGRRILQGLREPLEEGSVRLVRAGKRESFPADFHLVLAMNACPCGNLGKEQGLCLCSENEIERYWRRLGGALMDRIDMRIAVPAREEEGLWEQTGGSKDLRERIFKAYEIQIQRNKEIGGRFNNRLSFVQLRKVCLMEGDVETLYIQAGKALNCSARGMISVLRISRTIGDLAGQKKIQQTAILEAFQYRRYGDGPLYWPFS
ncbi:MAG: YifB family Mg chelatase-like AAA ATPase [Spirochaetales bacterium]